MAERLGADNGR